LVPDSDVVVLDETVGGRVGTATVTPRFTAAAHPQFAGYPVWAVIEAAELLLERVFRVDCVDTDSEYSGDLGTNDLGMDRCRTHAPLRNFRKACPNSGYFIVF
jgi:hypothetical protein